MAKNNCSSVPTALYVCFYFKQQSPFLGCHFIHHVMLSKFPESLFVVSVGIVSLTIQGY